MWLIVLEMLLIFVPMSAEINSYLKYFMKFSFFFFLTFYSGQIGNYVLTWLLQYDTANQPIDGIELGMFKRVLHPAFIFVCIAILPLHLGTILLQKFKIWLQANLYL